MSLSAAALAFLCLSQARYEDWQERAAILEYEAGMSRPDAEEMALRLVEEAIGKSSL